VQPHVPTSVMLAQLLKDLPQDQVSPAWLIGRLEKRSFGLVMLLLALVGLLPGVGIVIGILLAFPAVQMILGRETPNLSRFLSSRSPGDCGQDSAQNSGFGATHVTLTYGARVVSQF
jgi:hypothetical protein